MVIAAAALLLRAPVLETRHEELLRHAVEIAARSDALAPHLAAPPRSHLFAAASSVGWSTRQSAAATAAALLESASGDSTPAALHRAGVGFFLNGEYGAAVRSLRTATSRESHPEWWSDLAAAETALGQTSGDPEHDLAALEAVDRALALDADLAAGHFNRGLLLEKLGFERQALAEWRAVSGREPPALKRIAAISRKKTARELWADAERRITSIAPAELELLIDAHPQEARLWGETVFLTIWARKTLLHDPTADHFLDQTRFIADRLASRSGERLLRDAIAIIDRLRVSGKQRRLEELAGAQIVYYDGRLAFKAGNFDKALRRFDHAHRSFAACGSAMSGVAQSWAAMSKISRNEIGSARTILAELLDRQRRSSGHRALAAHAEYLIALCDSMRGRWGDALEEASASRDEFDRLGERGFAGSAEMQIGDLLSFLGQPQLAWRHLLRASAALSQSGEWDRVQVCAAVMNQVELRRHRWLIARSISKIELTLRERADLVAHAHLRSASAEAWSGDASAAIASIRNATSVARSIPNTDVREKILADISAVEGGILAASHPAAGIARLTESIDFQIRVGRLFALPSLYLDRGRAQAARGARDAALADFEEGIRNLETQRAHVHDYELGIGIFDDARDLFADAVDVTLRSGDVLRAFEYLERGRARALLDELAEPAAAPARTTIEAVQQSLAPGTLLVSYALLPDRVAIFVVDSERLAVRYCEAGAKRIAGDSDSLVRAIRSRGETSVLSARLYDALIEPIAADVARSTALVIIPDPVIERLPFAALLKQRTGRYLIESHELSIAPSAAVFVACARRSKTIGAVPPRSIAVFANPALPDSESLAFLPAADAGAMPIAHCYPRSLVLRRSAATALRFRSEAPRYEIVQFSGHARVDRAEPWRSALMLDSPLSAREISTLRLTHTKLVVLGACSTLAPQADHVESTSAIARAFLTAGVPAVVGSLWDVDDASAAAVMRRLHKRLSTGMPAATALREVQRDLSRDPAYRGLRTWAAFAIVGEHRAQ